MIKKLTKVHLIIAIIVILIGILLAPDLSDLRYQIDSDQKYLFVPVPFGNVAGNEIISYIDSVESLLEELNQLRQQVVKSGVVVIHDTIYVARTDTIEAEIHDTIYVARTDTIEANNSTEIPKYKHKLFFITVSLIAAIIITIRALLYAKKIKTQYYIHAVRQKEIENK